jgi:hypothetical protein
MAKMSFPDVAGTQFKTPKKKKPASNKKSQNSLALPLQP